MGDLVVIDGEEIREIQRGPRSDETRCSCSEAGHFVRRPGDSRFNGTSLSFDLLITHSPYLVSLGHCMAHPLVHRALTTSTDSVMT